MLLERVQHPYDLLRRVKVKKGEWNGKRMTGLPRGVRTSSVEVLCSDWTSDFNPDAAQRGWRQDAR